MDESNHDSLPSLKQRRILNWINVTVMSVLLLGICIVANVIANTHPIRKDLTTDKLYEVSDNSRKVIKNLKEDLVIYTTRTHEGPFANDRSLPEAWNQIDRLMNELFVENQSRIKVIAITQGSPDVKDFMQLFPSTQANSMFFSTKDDSGRAVRKIVSIYECFSGNPQDGEISEFRAEQRIVSTISQLTSAKRKYIYWTNNHRETSSAATDRDGLSVVAAKLLEYDNVEFKPLNLKKDGGVPKDAEVVFIAGPREDFDTQEIDMLQDYWKGGGRIFVASHVSAAPPSLLYAFLEDCGAQISRDLIFDASSTNAVQIRITKFINHPANEGMQGQAFDMFQTQSIEPSPKRPTVQAKPLMMTSGGYCWAETDLSPKGNPKPDNGEKQGEINVAVVSEEYVQNPRNPDRKTARLIAWGSMTSMTNAMLVNFNGPNPISQGYILNNFRWLMQREEFIAEPKNPRKMKPPNLTPPQASGVLWISVAALPLLGVLLGLMAWFFRRK